MPGGPSRCRARPARWLGLQRGSRSSSCVESALGLGEAGPAAGTGVFAGRDPAGARLAADGRVAVGEKRVDLDPVLLGLVQLNPIAAWTLDEVITYAEEHRV